MNNGGKANGTITKERTAGTHLMYEEMLQAAQWLFQDDTPKEEIASF